MAEHENDIVIGKDRISTKEPAYIIAEIGINHNGNITTAKKLIDVAVDAGANAVKFQKRSLNDIYREDVLKDPNIESQGLEILLDVLNEVEFDDDAYKELTEYCKEKHITFLCTPWDIPSVEFLEKFDLPAYKIASADMTNFPLISSLIQTGKPLIVSTGMSNMNEIEKTVSFMKEKNAKFALLHCNSTYPAPVETLNLELISLLKEKFQVLIGYSGHEPGIVSTLAAVMLGAIIVERHITLDKTMEGLDQAASLEPDEFKKLVKDIREAEKAKGKPIKKMTRGEILQKEVLGKSITAKNDIKKDEIFSENNLAIKGPAKGLSPQYYYEILGKKSKREIKRNDYLQDDDL
ncbi:N-acetylneuraminate synthase family protein [Nitrosopumilus maritimus]|uniref:N-acetylneuraminate synthase family protein n=1 Tax=Nitrosopumilus maritimus TaxID=338192 RepID=UPI000159B02E|nr:N-acetylneuraminate synthase family protein [Nitrosopumilus maritimus]